MKLVTIENNLPGISGIMAQFTHTTASMRLLAHSLLVDTSKDGKGSLSRWEKELIATYVSSQNKCEFCTNSHAYVAGHHFGMQFVWNFLSKDIHALVRTENEKLIPLMRIAEMVRNAHKADARMQDYADEAKEYGWSDTDIHDTVLIASAFCMYNRYVNALAQNVPVWGEGGAAQYEAMAENIVNNGYNR